MTAISTLRNLKLERIERNAKMVAVISPCSFMYPRYGLQISVTLNDGQESILGNHQPMESVTEADVQALFETVKTHKCVQCEALAFDRNTISTNLEGMCWTCINELCKREFEAGAADDVAELERELAAIKSEGKAKGFTHLVTAVIHPESGVDDYVKYFFTKTDNAQQIEAVIRKTGSAVLTDYRVEPL